MFIKRLLFILFPLIFSTELFFIRLCLAGIITEYLSLSFDIYKDVPSFICLSLGIYKIFCHLLHCSTLVPTTLSFFYNPILLCYVSILQYYACILFLCALILTYMYISCVNPIWFIVQFQQFSVYPIVLFVSCLFKTK